MSESLLKEGCDPFAITVRYMVDSLLADCSGRDLFSTNELADRLLDIRLVLNEHIVDKKEDSLDKSEGEEEVK